MRKTGHSAEGTGYGQGRTPGSRAIAVAIAVSFCFIAAIVEIVSLII